MRELKTGSVRKILCLSVIAVMLTAGISSALSLGDMLPSLTGGDAVPENALSIRSNESVYLVFKADDISSFLKWLMSEKNINLFMPLVLSSEDSNDIIGGIELFRMFAENTPLKSAAFIVGTDRPESKDVKTSDYFFQIAFTVSDDVSSVVKKIADGSAEDKDFAKLLLGSDSPLVSMLETMLKAEKLDGNVYKVDNELFVKAQDGLIIAGVTSEDLSLSLKALAEDKERLFGESGNVNRKLNTAKNYLLAHIDYETIDRLDTKGEFDSADIATEYFDKPFNFELGFESLPDKFVVNIASNIRHALRDKYAAKLPEKPSAVKGCYMDLSEGGAKSPLAALSGMLHILALKDQKETASSWNEVVRQLKARFGITEDEFADLFEGIFTLSVNDSVTFEGMKIPALYLKQTGSNGAAEKVFAKLTKSKHFHKIQDGVLQMDTSLSPVSCLIQDKGETLGINFAEAVNLTAKPVIKPALADLMNTEGISAIWIDFDEIRNWLLNDENGVFAMAMPMAKMMGFGEVVEAVRDVLTAEFSVPSMSFMALTPEELRFEFANASINPENGLFAKLIGVYLKFMK